MKGKALFLGFLSSCGRSILFTVALILVVLLAAPFVDAQSTGGRIRGTVTDPSGAAVVGVTVSLKNEATGTERDAPTDANGEYVFLEVPVGVYTVELQQTGFKKYLR